MATALCPGQFLWACNTTDLFVQVALIIVIVAFVVMFGIFLYLRGEWGGIFYHADKSDIAIEVHEDNSVDGYHVERFGSMLRAKYGRRKGTLIIPRPGSSYKTAKSPNLRIVLGMGISTAADLYLSEYVTRLGEKWTEWNGQKPPVAAKDLRQFYVGYAEMKAELEKKPDKNLWITTQMAQLDVPATLSPEETKTWADAQRKAFGDAYEEGAWGPFTIIVRRLQMSDLDDKQRFGIYQTLNDELAREPAPVLPIWIGGFQIDARRLAAWAGPVLGAQMQSIINAVEKALKADDRHQFMQIMMVILAFFGIAVAFAIVYQVVK